MSRFMRGRRRTSVLLGAALLALAFGVSVGLAKSGPSQYSHLKLFNDPTFVPDLPGCPEPANGKDPHGFGKASVTISKSAVTVKVHLHGAVDGTYVAFLGVTDGTFCIPAFGGVEFKVKKGDGNGSDQFDLPPGLDGLLFFVGAVNEDTLDSYVSDPRKFAST